MNDFDKFDSMVDLSELGKSIKEAQKNSGEYPEVPKGTYKVALEKFELGNTRDNRPMAKAQFKILEGQFRNMKLFFNRAIYGTKNDANMIANVLGFINSLQPSEDVGPIVFTKYSQFADLLLDVAEDCSGDIVTYSVNYDPDAFNSISVVEVYE